MEFYLTMNLIAVVKILLQENNVALSKIKQKTKTPYLGNLNAKRDQTQKILSRLSGLYYNSQTRRFCNCNRTTILLKTL